MVDVDPREKDAMKKLIALMNEGVALEDGRPTEAAKSITGNKSLSDIKSNEIDPVADMKSIMLAFQGQQNPAERLNERANVDRELREALVTEATERGTRIGSWEIVNNENENGLKTYDVVNIHTNEAIASDLTLYDAARGLARHLNEGMTINSRPVREILNAEAQYDSSRADAAHFKARMESATNDTRRAVMEDRFAESLKKAKEARVRLLNAVK